MDSYDFNQLAHRVIDGLVIGDKISILIAIGYVLVAFGSTWLLAKSAKAGSKAAYRGAKWMLTPREDSELAKSIEARFQSGDVRVTNDGKVLATGKVRYYCDSNVPFRRQTFTTIYVNDTNVTHLLSRRERKKLYKMAYALRKETVKQNAESARKCAEAEAISFLNPPAKKMECKDATSRLLKAEQAAAPVPAPAKNADGLCQCATCVESRKVAKVG